MKKAVLAVIVAAACIASSATAHAFTVGTTFDVTANVVEACTVTATGITFPDYDGVAYQFGTGGVTVTCPTGIPYNIALDGGLHYDGTFFRQMASGTNMLRYDLTKPAGGYWGDSDYENTYPNGSSLPDTGDGTPQAHTVGGTIRSAQPVPPGAYSDTVTVTVHY